MKEKEIYNIFFNLVDPRASEFIARKVSKQNGDIRVAFDMMKSALEALRKKIKANKFKCDKDICISVPFMLKVYEMKYCQHID